MYITKFLRLTRERTLKSETRTDVYDVFKNRSEIDFAPNRTHRRLSVSSCHGVQLGCKQRIRLGRTLFSFRDKILERKLCSSHFIFANRNFLQIAAIAIFAKFRIVLCINICIIYTHTVHRERIASDNYSTFEMYCTYTGFGVFTSLPRK